MGQCHGKRKSKSSEEGKKKMRPQELNQTDNINSSNPVNDPITSNMNTNSFKSTCKLKYSPDSSKFQRTSENLTTKSVRNQNIVQITEEINIKFKPFSASSSEVSTGNVTSNSVVLNSLKKRNRLVSKDAKISNIHSIKLKEIDKRIAFFQNLQDKTDHSTFHPKKLSSELAIFKPKIKSITPKVSSVVKATTENKEKVFVSSKTLTVKPKSTNDLKILKKDKTLNQTNKINDQENKIIIKIEKLNKEQATIKDCKKSKLGNATTTTATTHQNLKQFIVSKKEEKNIKQLQKRNDKSALTNKSSQNVCNEKERLNQIDDKDSAKEAGASARQRTATVRYRKRSNSLPELKSSKTSSKSRRNNLKLKPIKSTKKKPSILRKGTSKPLPDIGKKDSSDSPTSTDSSGSGAALAKYPLAMTLLKLTPEDGLQWARHTTISKNADGVTEKTINVVTRRIFKNGKWMEETTKTETLTNEKGTTKISEKTSYRDLALNELPNPEKETERPSGFPDSISSSTVRIPPSTKPQPGKTVPKRDNKPLVKDDPESFARQVLVATNSYRKLHGVPPLRPNDKLNKLAKEWADKLARTEKMEHGDKKGIGENIYCKTSSQPWFEMSGAEVVENWYSEVKDHRYNEEPSQGFLRTGHFTQLVWKDTKDLGVAFARNKNGHMAYVVAYYSPKGNWIGAFKEQVLPPGGVQKPKQQKTSKIKTKNAENSKGSKNNTSKNNIILPKQSNKKLEKYIPEPEMVTDTPDFYSEDIDDISKNTPDSASIYNKGSRASVDTPGSYTSRASIFTPSNRNNSPEPYRSNSRTDSRRYSGADQGPGNSPGSDTNSQATRRTKSRKDDNYSDPGYQSPVASLTSRGSATDTPANNRSKSRSDNKNYSDAEAQSPIRSPPTRVTTVAPLTAFVTDKNFYEDCLHAHNYYRERHGCEHLSLNDKLSKYAQEWADTIASEDLMDHRPDNEYGENIYMKWTSEPNFKIPGEEAVDSWYEEINDYQFGREPTDLSAGHFTQVIWSDSEELGVGVAKSRSGKIYVVANYDPPGNYLGQFSKKVPPPL